MGNSLKPKTKIGLMRKRTIVIVTVTLIYSFIFYKIFEQFNQIDLSLININYKLFASLALIQFAFFLNAVMYVKILEGLGSRPESTKNIVLLNFMMQPIKYIPLGSVLNAITQGTVFGKLKGINKVSALLSPFLGLYITVLSGSILFWLFDFWFLRFGYIIHILIGIGNLLGIILLFPKFIRYLFLLIQRISKNRLTIDEIESQKFGKYLIQSFFLSVIFWISLGSGTYLAIQNIIYIKELSIFNFIASYAISSVIGYLLIIFPSGLGIREGALVFLFHGLISPFPYLIAVISRISWIVAELINFILALIIGKSLLKGIKNELKK